MHWRARENRPRTRNSYLLRQGLIEKRRLHQGTHHYKNNYNANRDLAMAFLGFSTGVKRMIVVVLHAEVIESMAPRLHSHGVVAAWS